MKLSKLYKNKFVQGASMMMVTILVTSGIASATIICIPTTVAYCEVQFWNTPYKTPGYWDVDSEAAVSCKSTKRVAIEHKLQKKNSVGVWINVKSPGYTYGTTYAKSTVHVDCTNDKNTTWRSATTVVINYGAVSWSNTSQSAVYACGT